MQYKQPSEAVYHWNGLTVQAFVTKTAKGYYTAMVRSQDSLTLTLQLVTSIITMAHNNVKPGFHYPSWWPELTGDRFPLPVNMGRVDGRAFTLAELTGRQLG